MTSCPGPARRPFVDLQRELSRDPMNFALRIAARFGGLAGIPLRDGDSLFLLSCPDLVREMLIDRRALFVKNTRYDALRRLLGNGMLLSEDDVWRRQRRLLQPAFKPAALAAHYGWTQELIAGFVERWQPAADRNVPVDMMGDFQRLAQAVAARLTFGPSFAGRESELFETLRAIWQAWPARPGVADWLRWRRTRERAQRLDRAMTDLDRLLFDAVERSRAAGVQEGGLICFLLDAAVREGAPFTATELRDQAITLIGAGYETSASAMCWTHILLARHPHVRQGVFAEVDALTGAGGPITPAQLESLEYTERVIKESLRVHLPIHSFARVAVADTMIGGCPIAKGQTAVVSVHALHHQHTHWPQPHVFDPGRFTADQCAQRSRYAYLPFGLGARACIGAAFAMTEAVLTVALIARRFRLELVPGQTFEPAPGTTVYPRHGLKMFVHTRVPPAGGLAPSGLATRCGRQDMAAETV